MKTNKFLWRIHPVRALAEAGLIGLLFFLSLASQVGHVSPYVMGNGMLFLCGLCGMWTVLRTRLPSGSWLWQGIWELAVGFVLSLMVALGVHLVVRLMDWQELWRQSNLGGAISVTFVLLATGPGYVVARLGVRFWLLWERMRRRRMLWAITHAHLTVVVVVIALGVLGSALLVSLSGGVGSTLSEEGWFTFFIERVLHTIFPAVGLIAFMTVLALMVLLPPSALFSFWVARKTTRRLEKLASAAGALRDGDYQTRVGVEGEDEVAQLQTNFNAMADDLERTMRDLQVQRDTVARLLQSRRELVASVSHELRTPVATLRGYLESALANWDDDAPAALRHDLEVMEGEADRLQALLDDLFALSRAEVGRLAFDLQPTDVGAVIQRRVEAMAPLAWQSGRVEVVAETPPDLPFALVDGGRLEQILNNLLRNAVRHTPPGGIVAVVAAAEEDAVRVEVRDTGEGIPPEELPHIWERFYRGERASTGDRRGAGLGLALVKELTEAMGGSVEVESVVGRGSCFAVRLPKRGA
jgi:signal transduction histidine kinase